MEIEKSEIYGKFVSRLSSAANWILRITGSLIFLVLVWYSMRYTQHIPQYYNELPVNNRDSSLKNCLALLSVVIVFLLLMKLENHISIKSQVWIRRILLVAMCIWFGVAGLLWITSTDRIPVGDQAFIYGGASYFIEGEYFFLEKGAYCDMCPHQLGLIALVELLFRIVGTYNYFAIQLINVGMTVGISLLGYLLVCRLSKRFATVAIYCILMCFCLPLILYTGWVYGDIPSVFFILLTAYCLLRYAEAGRWGWLAGMTASVLMAVLVRKNSLIMLIALCLTAGVYALAKKDKKLLIALVLSAILPWLAYTGIYKMYQVRSGTEALGGIPAVSYLAMGMQESDEKYGWFTQYCKDVYWAADSDPKLAAETSWQDVRERLDVFMKNPSYAWMFYREKILSQWNQPLYQSLFFSGQYAEDVMPEPDSIDARVHGEFSQQVLNICDRLQFILYFGLFCYFLFAVRKGSNLLEHMLAATIVGGFFFSILWEAKARYIFSYYVFMYPLAAVGLLLAVSRCEELAGGIWKRLKKDGNVS